MQHRERYPKNWAKLALDCKEKANWTCQHCGLYIPREGVKMISRKGKEWTMYLCAAHIDHDTENENPRLLALCLICHAKYDYSQEQIKRRIEAEQRRHAILIAQAGYTPAKTRLVNIERYRAHKRSKELQTA
jgi:hypothetical protein